MARNVNKLPLHMMEQKRRMTDIVKILNFLKLKLEKEIMKFDFKHISIIKKYIDFHWYGKLSCNVPK